MTHAARNRTVSTGFVVIGLALAALAPAEEAPRPEGPASDASGDSVRIVAIRPDPSVPLIAGDEVRIEVEVEYAFGGSDGALALVVQGDGFAMQSEKEPVSPGRGVASLEVTFTVPGTAKLEVFTPLAAEGSHQASAVDGRSFSVKTGKPRDRHSRMLGGGSVGLELDHVPPGGR